jgi:hypothetical protein
MTGMRIGLLAATGVLAASCTSHPAATHPHLLPDTAGGPLTISYSFGSAHNPFTALPPRPGQRPTVSATAAQHAVADPAGWPTGAERNHLTAFGYGRVTAAALDAEGGVDPTFARGRLAWVAIYRSSTAHLLAPTCPSPRTLTKREHLVQPRQTATFRLVVIVDAVTGHQAIWDDLRDICPYLAPDLAARDGRVVGRFLAVGGPVGAHAEPQHGTIFLRSGGRTRAATMVGPDGRFVMVAAAGTYALAGKTPQFTVSGGSSICRALHPVRVRRHRTTRASVYCQRN